MKQIGISYQKWNLVAWLNEQDGNAWIAVAPICDAIGIASWRQQQKIKEDPRFSSQHMLATGADGKQYEMLCIPAMQVSGWLYGINSKKVSPEVGPKLFEFQQYVTQAIYDAVSGRANSEVVDRLEQIVELLRQELQEVREEVKEIRRENGFLKAQVGPYVNQEVSNAARTLRNGHLKN